MKNSSILVLLASIIFLSCTAKNEVSAIGNDGGFVDVKEFIPSVELDIRYYTTDNFVGLRIDGYDAPKCLLTREAAVALKNVQEELARNGQSLKIFDCYRPQHAVDHFMRWAKDSSDQKMKSKYYPSIDKENLFKNGYIAAKSGHSRGSTLDLTIIDLESNRELDMGTDFDFFDPLSHTVNSRIGKSQQDNRIDLKSVMERNGFENLEEEWWHFTLKSEPYPDKYFDFKIE
ncbi:MAG TPA: M15 family metallopeptidase [Candidatus Binatia bacterium]|nr:M15 family metallopeptidase [Candidatus Binatia bacterium]